MHGRRDLIMWGPGDTVALCPAQWAEETGSDSVLQGEQGGGGGQPCLNTERPRWPLQLGDGH